MHKVVAVQVVDSERYLIENIECQLLPNHLLPLQQLQRVPPLEVLGHDVDVTAVVEHFEHFDDVGVVLSGAGGTIWRRISNSLVRWQEMRGSLLLRIFLIARSWPVVLERTR